jgi:hypothetical protein
LVLPRLRTCDFTNCAGVRRYFPGYLDGVGRRFAKVVAFDGEFPGLADRRAQGPMTAAAGPHGDKGGVWGYAFFQPIAGAVEEGCGCKEAVAVARCGADLAFQGGLDADGVHGWFLGAGIGACVHQRSRIYHRGVVCPRSFAQQAEREKAQNNLLSWKALLNLEGIGEFNSHESDSFTSAPPVSSSRPPWHRSFASQLRPRKL